MSYTCNQCGKTIELGPNAKVARKDTCEACGADLHTCTNCQFYDEGAYNECYETQAERVVDKNRSNFCDYFSYRSSDAGSGSNVNKKDYMKSLDDLFK